MKFEWKKFPGFTTLQILAEIQKMMTEIQCEHEQILGRIILMSMYNDIEVNTPVQLVRPDDSHGVGGLLQVGGPVTDALWFKGSEWPS